MSKVKLANDDPAKKLAQAVSSIYFVAGLNIVLGSIGFILKVKFLQTLGFSLLSVGLGLVFLVLGFLTQRRSRFALVLAVILFCLEGVAVLLLGLSELIRAFSAGNSLHEMAEILQNQSFLIGVLTAWLFFTIAWPIQMMKGISAIKKLKKETPASVS